MIDPGISTSLDRAASVVARHAASQRLSPVLGLRLSHVEASTPLAYRRYSPSLSAVFAGRKRSIIGDDDRVWGQERFLITPVDLPVIAGVVAPDPDRGFVAVTWQLDMVLVHEVAAAAPRTRRPPASPDRLGEWSVGLADAFARLVGLLDEPEHAASLGPLYARETVLRLLQTEQAPRVLAAVESESAVVREAVRLLNTRMAEPWTMSVLAAEVRASESSLFKRFKDATSMSPMQYLKRTRLGEARRRMIVRGDSAGYAAEAVGYKSASHFSRDYLAAYGRSPARDAAQVRDELRAPRPI